MHPSKPKKRIFQLDPALTNAILECEKKTNGKFGTFKCALKPSKNKSFWKSLFHGGYKGIYKNAKKLFIIDIILMLAIVVAGAVGAFFVFWDPSVIKFIELEIIQKQEILANGQSTAFTINYKNTSEVELQNVELRLLPIPEFVIQSAKPQNQWNLARKTWTIPNIMPDTGGEVQVEGILIMNQRKKEKLIAELSYHQKEKTKKERKAVIKELSTQKGLFTAEHTAPLATLRGSNVTITSTLSHNAAITLKNINVKTQLQPISSVPTLEDGVWNVAEWPPNTPYEFVLSTEANQKDNLIPITYTPTIIYDNKIIELPIDDQKNITIIDPQISINFIESWNQTLEFGNPLPFELNISNNGRWPIKSWEIRLIPTQKIRLSAGHDTTLINNNIIWKETQELNPGSTKKINATINIPNLKNQKDIKFTPELHYTIDFNGSELKGSLKGKTSSYSLLALPTLYSEARYFNVFGDQLGRGPLPPKVDQETKYWIHWNLQSGSQQFQNIKLSTPLPSHSTFTGKGSVTKGHAAFYDKTSHSMVWEASNLDPDEKIDIFFEVAVKPTNAHKGQPIQITGETNLEAYSNNKNYVTTKSDLPLTSELYNDDTAKNYGSSVE